jgi:hypothetical protein
MLRLRLSVLFLLAAINVSFVRSTFADPEEAICTAEETEFSSPSLWERYLWKMMTLGMNLAGYKSEDDAVKYIGCYLSQKDHRTAFLTKYRALIRKASEASGVPFSILACLYLKESHYDATVQSDARPDPAVGIAQLLPDTWNEMIIRIDGAPAMKNPEIPASLRAGVPNDGGSLDVTVSKIEKIYAEKFRDGKLSDRASINQLHDLFLEYRANQPKTVVSRLGMNHRRPKSKVDPYLENVRYALEKFEMRDMVDAYYGGPEKRPKVFLLTDPKAAIIVGAAYLKSVIFQGMFEENHQYRYPNPDRWVMAAGAYNTGLGGSHCDGDMNAEECIQITIVYENQHPNTRHENSRHMQSIRNCAEQGNWEPMKGDSKARCGT